MRLCHVTVCAIVVRGRGDEEPEEKGEVFPGVDRDSKLSGLGGVAYPAEEAKVGMVLVIFEEEDPGCLVVVFDDLGIFSEEIVDDLNKGRIGVIDLVVARC